MTSNLPKTYKAAVFEEVHGPLVITDVELQLPKEGEILIKVLATGVCGTDLGEQAGLLWNSFPIVPGHETIGEVVAVGPNEKVWKIGDRAGGAWHGGQDGSCTACRRGLFNMCANQIVNGVTKDGGFAEYEILHTSAAVRIPAGIDPAKAAPLLCAGVTVFASIRKQHTPPGSTVVVVGLGGLGHLAVQYAAKMGYHVVAISSSSSKASFAHQLGAHDYIDTSKQDLVETLNAMGGAALIVYTAPSPKLLPSLLNTFQPAGKLLVLSPCGDFPVSSAILIQKGVSVTGYATGTALDNEEAIAFAERHGVECLIEKFPLAEAQKALEHTKSGNVRFRSVLVM